MRDRFDKSIYESYEPGDSPSIAKPSEGESKILSPIALRAKGRPPFLRQSIYVEVLVKRKNKSIKKKVNIVSLQFCFNIYLGVSILSSWLRNVFHVDAMLQTVRICYSTMCQRGILCKWFGNTKECGRHGLEGGQLTLTTMFRLCS